MYKVQLESVTGISHYISYVRLIMIILMLHVFGRYSGSHIVLTNSACKLYISNRLLCGKSYDSTPKVRS